MAILILHDEAWRAHSADFASLTTTAIMSALVKSVGSWGRLKKIPSQKDLCEV